MVRLSVTSPWQVTGQAAAGVSVLLIYIYFLVAYERNPPDKGNWVLLLLGLLLALPYLLVFWELFGSYGRKAVFSTVIWGTILGSGLFFLLSRAAGAFTDSRLADGMVGTFILAQCALAVSAIKLYVGEGKVRDYVVDVLHSLRETSLLTVIRSFYLLAGLFGLLCGLLVLFLGYQILEGLGRFLEAPIGIKPRATGSLFDWLAFMGLFAFGFLSWICSSVAEKIDSLRQGK